MLVRNLHREIRKVALVSDSALLSAAPSLIDHFVATKVRYFPTADIAPAQIWTAPPEMRSDRFVILDGYPTPVAAVRAEGTLIHEDYEDTLIPLSRTKSKHIGRLRLLYWPGLDFKGFAAGAMWDDARLSLAHLGDFPRSAVVSDLKWVRQDVKTFVPLAKVQT